MSKNKVCAIFGVTRGYEEEGYDIRLAQLKRTVREQVENGTDTFITSGNIGYEMDIAEYIIDSFPNVDLILTQPYRDKSVHYNFRGQYEYIMENASEVIYISDSRNAKEANNEQAIWIMEHCDFVITISNREDKALPRATSHNKDIKPIIALPTKLDGFNPTEEELHNKYRDNEKAPNDNERWTAEERERLEKEYLGDRLGIRTIAEKHGRSERAIQNELRRMSILGEYDTMKKA